MNYRTINLEEGMPSAPEAARRLIMAVRLARKQGIRAMKIIHGFGSSGTGGKIRITARRELDKLQKSGHIQFYVPGEKLSIFDENTRRALDTCPALRGDSDIDRHNNGITLVVF